MKKKKKKKKGKEERGKILQRFYRNYKISNGPISLKQKTKTERSP